MKRVVAGRVLAFVATRSPGTQDLALAVALAAYNVGSLIPEVHQLKLPYVAFTLVVLQVLPLAWRRRWPVLVWIAVGIPRSLYDNLGISYAPLPLGPLISYYTVMDQCSTRTRWLVSAGTLLGVIRAELLPGHTPYELFVGMLEFGTAGLLGTISRTRRAYLAEVEARASRERADHDRDVALAAAAERTRIARELHDVVAHHVSLMAVQSEAAASLLPGRPAAASKAVEIIGQTAREALTELRQLLGLLREPASVSPLSPLSPLSPAPSISSLESLEEVLGQVRRAGIAVDLRVAGSPAKLGPGVDLTAYRIVQEALTNTIRHSGADQAAVTVAYEPGFVTVSVADTGHGPLVNGARSGSGHGPSGFGLAGIAERVASCGGSLTIGPGQAGGFAVTAKLPTP